MKNKILITGCAGFVGSNLAEKLIKNKNNHVIGIDNLSTGQIRFLSKIKKKKNFEFVKQDLLNFSKITKYFLNVNMVFHLAANADVRNGVNNPKKDLEQNIMVTHNVLEAMRINNVKKIFFSSTASIYGETKIIPTPENIDIPQQTSMYAASKISCEALIQAYCEGFNMKSWIFRFVSVLGKNYTHGHVFDFVKNYLQNEKTLNVLGNGNQKKSYMSVEDCVAGILCATKKSKDKVNIFNIGYEDILTVKSSIKIISRKLNWKPNLKFGNKKRGWIGDIPYILLDVSKLKKLGWKPKYDIEHSVESTVDFLINNKWVFEKRKN